MNKSLSILKKCTEDEIPYFIISARDKCSVPALLKYIDQCYVEGCSAEFINDVTQRLAEFSNYQFNHGNKIPD